MKNRAQIKEQLRKKYLTIRSSLSREESEGLSERIIQHVIRLPEFQQAETIHTYIPLAKNREVDTVGLLEHCFKEKKTVVVPKMEANGLMSHHKISSTDQLSENRWGILEPDHEDEISVSDINCIIVPMVAGDHQKNRIGYGKGYYDRFLGAVKTFHIGLTYNCTLAWKPLPVESFDQPMNRIITETGVIR